VVGAHEHSVDSKNRIIIPAKMRSQLGESFYLTIGYDRSLRAFSEEEFNRYKKDIDDAPEEDPTVRTLRRFFYSYTDCVELDKQGRILISARLKEFAGIKDEVIIAAQSRYVEIWAKENWSWDFGIADSEAANGLLSSISKYKKKPPVED